MIALKQGNQNPQNNMIASFSFTSTSKCNSLLKSFTSAGREILTQRSNLTPQQAKNAANDLTAFDIKQVDSVADFTPSSPFSRKLQLEVYSE